MMKSNPSIHFLLVTIFLLGVASLAGCTEDDAGTSTDHICGVEGATQACVCSTGESGSQACRQDGAWAVCVCTEGIEDAGSDQTQDSVLDVEGEVFVEPLDVAFAHTQIGRTRNAQLTIRNGGDGDLMIQNIEIVDSSPYIGFADTFMVYMALEFNWRNGSIQSWVEHPSFALRSFPTK